MERFLFFVLKNRQTCHEAFEDHVQVICPLMFAPKTFPHGAYLATHRPPKHNNPRPSTLSKCESTISRSARSCWRRQPARVVVR